ncbi:MAG: glycosyltransferase [Chthoniobacterales bacterium]|nr:glycosyltransferase [Chthoniobacterales bacterium]
MFEKLPSLRGFQPQWFTGGSAAYSLPLIYDLVALTKPARVVTHTFGDGQIHFAVCQAVKELGLTTRCIALGRDGAIEDETWRRAVLLEEELYQNVSELRADVSSAIGGEIDLLFIDEIDSGNELEKVLSTYEPLLAPSGLSLFHGLALERADAPGPVWEKWIANRHAVRFSTGIGLGVASAISKNDLLEQRFDWLFHESHAADLNIFYQLAAERMDAQHLATEAAREVASLTARQVWLDTILDERRETQRILKEQGETLANLQPRFEAWQRDRDSLRRDRAKAQLVMDAQLEQLKHWTSVAQRYQADRDRYKLLAKEQKEVIRAAQKACRKKGRCFPSLPGEEPKKPRPIGERILRELKRAPANLLRRKRAIATEPSALVKSVSSARGDGPKTDQERYAEWIEQHEPNENSLETQRRENVELVGAPTISLLLPAFNTPGPFLEEMLASITAQTYSHWELCLVDAGSSNAETLAVLEKQRAMADQRVKIERLTSNLGIAENTNRALALATGDFVACVDHDDLLAPFALHEVARAILASPTADMIYSDEDRYSTESHRHSPFFKPEWSPELLCSFMYVGHLTAYRRSLAVELGGYRKEFDLSQDYDFALRASERAREIKHIPHVLYHWREHPASGSAGGKPEARKTNLAALADAMRRRNLPAEIIEYPTANRARLTITRWPRVSIIVTTDSPTRGRACALELPKNTNYPNLEIVIVTNSGLAETLENAAPKSISLKFVPYDKPFNFSDKCNVGAAAATGERLIFFNDDVVPIEPGWVQELIEQLENPEIGAVAPRLLYESGKIQHAGLVTGVRGLVGTACHQWPADSSSYFNFAQSLRDVSALSAACLAMRRDDFFRLGQFDSTNSPIAHSDIDLCFKIRAAGLRCVYTPFVTMTHLGHASISTLELKETTISRDRASIYLWQRWAGYSSHDPYYPENMRDWLYQDSPTPIRMWGSNCPGATLRETHLLLVSHDLSWSGAPLLLLHTAVWCKEHGFFVVVAAPQEGPLREKFTEAGLPVIVDPLAIQGHSSFAEFAREFDCVLASTIFGAPIILAAKTAGVPHLWWIHEGQVAEHYIMADINLRSALKAADLIVAPDTCSAQIYQLFTEREVRILNSGIPDPCLTTKGLPARESKIVRFLLLGTIEERKGQRVFLEALAKLPDHTFSQAEFQIVGRAHDDAIVREIEEATRKYSQLSYHDSVTHEEALAFIQASDVVVSASWDETGPLILMEALALGKPILSTKVGAVAEHLSGEEIGLFFQPGDATALALAMQRLVREPRLRQEFARKARPAYEQHFTFARFAEGFVTLLREAVSSKRPMSRPTLAQS